MRTIRERPGASRPLRVALVSTVRAWGGGEEQARLLALGLRARGHSCHMLVGHDSALAQRMAAEAFPVHPVLGGREGKLNPRVWWRLRHELAALKPDVLHLNDSAAVTCAQVATIGLRIPAVVHQRHTCFPVRHPALYRRVCHRIVCVTAEGARICSEAGLTDDLLRVVCAGSDARRIAEGDRAAGRQKLGLGEQEKLLLTVAAFNECKGHRYLLEALPSVLSRHPNLRVAFAGDGPLRGSLKQQALQLGVAERIMFLGFRDDVPDLLQAADLCVIPSLLEGICSTLVEAMLAGAPVVTTVVGGMGEAVAPAQGDPPLAWTIPPRDSAAISRTILQALSSPEESDLRARRAMRHAEQHLTSERTVAGMEQVYFDVLAERGWGRQAERQVA